MNCLVLFLAALRMMAIADAVPPPAAVTDDSVLHNEAFAVGRGLRCPVCQGMPIAESPSSMARDMMKRVGDLLREGKSREQIDAYFVERYGEWVLLDPPRQGFTTWVWALPPLLFVGTLVWAIWHMRRLRQSPSAAAMPPAAVDPYLQAVRDEVER